MVNEDAPKITSLQSMMKIEEKEKNPSKEGQPSEGECTLEKEPEEGGDNSSTITATTDNISPKSVHSLSFADKIKLHHGRKFSRRYDFKIVLDPLWDSLDTVLIQRFPLFL